MLKSTYCKRFKKKTKTPARVAIAWHLHTGYPIAPQVLDQNDIGCRPAETQEGMQRHRNGTAFVRATPVQHIFTLHSKHHFLSIRRHCVCIWWLIRRGKESQKCLTSNWGQGFGNLGPNHENMHMCINAHADPRWSQIQDISFKIS